MKCNTTEAAAVEEKEEEEEEEVDEEEEEEEEKVLSLIFFCSEFVFLAFRVVFTVSALVQTTPNKTSRR